MNTLEPSMSQREGRGVVYYQLDKTKTYRYDKHLPYAQHPYLHQVQSASDPVVLRESLPVLDEFPVGLHGRTAEAVAVGVRTKVKAGALRRPAKPAKLSEVNLRLNDDTFKAAREQDRMLNARGHEVWAFCCSLR